MKTSKFSFIGLILSGIFAGIAFVLCFSIFDIMAQAFFELKLLFMLFNVFTVMFLACFSGFMSQKLTMPMFVAIAAVSGIYTLIQFTIFILFSLVFVDVQTGWYVLVELLLHFVYLAIVLPIGKAGYTIAHRKS